MFVYGIVVLPVVKRLKLVYPSVTQLWYIDNYGALGTCNNVELYLNSLKRIGLARGQYPNPTKIIMVVHPDNLEAGRLFGVSHGFKVCTGSHYIGGYIGDEESKRDWLKDRTDKWEINIRAVTKTAGKYPH